MQDPDRDATSRETTPSMTETSRDVAYVAYVLLLVFGVIGGHRFYLGRVWSGVAMLMLFAAGTVAMSFHVLGPVLLGVLAAWLCVDAALIARMVRRMTPAGRGPTAA